MGREKARVNGERDSTLIKLIGITISLGGVGREKALVNGGGGRYSY